MANESGLSTAAMHLIDQYGGVAGFLQQLQNRGLGQAVRSWISIGANQSVSPAQLHDALGGDPVREAAQMGGISTGDLLRQLSQYLPQIIDHVTPDGRLPETEIGWFETAANFLRK